jgi:large subunit ribosomal protein L25
MIQTIRIEAETRGQAGKGAARATRKQGLVPGVIYGAKQEAQLIALDPRVIIKELQKGGWQSHIFEVAVKDGTTERALMRDVQFHPVSDRPIHIDFQRLSAGSRIRVLVPVHFLNEATSPGLKAGGVLNVVRREVEVLADPENVPAHFEVDLGESAIGAALRWSAVKDTFGAKPVIAGRDFMIASVAAPTKVEEVAAGPTEAKPVEATKQKAPAAAAPAKDAKKK